MGDAGKRVVYRVNVDSKFLRYDVAAMSEPVGFGGLKITQIEVRAAQALTRAGKRNPAWVRRGVVCVPHSAYEISLKAVSSCWFAGTIPFAEVESVPFFCNLAGFYQIGSQA